MFFDARPVNLLPNGLTTFAQVKPIEAIPPNLPLGINANEDHVIYPAEIADWLIDNMALLPDASLNAGTLTQLNTAYNFGAGPVERTADRLIQSLNINSGGHLSINRNQEVGPGGNGWNAPIAGSLFEVETVDENCDGPLTVRVNSGGLLSVGDPNDHATGILRITEGNTLILNNNGTLRIHDHSTLIIERGATLRLNAGHSIELLGDDAVLEIRGTLEIEESLTFTGAGFIRLGLPYSLPGVDGNVRLLGSGLHSIYLAGSGPQDKVLEIMPDTHLQPGNAYELNQFAVMNGLVELGEDAYLNFRDAYIWMYQSTFRALPGQRFRTLYGNGQASHSIRQSTIRGARRGFTWRGQYGDQADLTIRTTEIADCEIGLYTQSSGADLRWMDLHDNNVGWYADQASGNSRVRDSEVYDQSGLNPHAAAGIVMAGSGNLHLRETHLHHNLFFGTALVSAGTLTAQACTEIDHHIFTGVSVDFSAVDFSGGSEVYLHDNYRAIYADFASEIRLDQGNNDLRSQNQYVLYGTLTTPSTTLLAHDNQWNNQTPNPIPPPGTPNPGTPPVYGQDYELNNASGNPITLQATPRVYDGCGVSPEPTGGGGYSTNRVAACSGCPVLGQGPLAGKRLDQALSLALDTLYDDTLGYPIPLTAVDWLASLLTQPYASDLDAQAVDLLHRTASYLREAFWAALDSGQVTRYAASAQPDLSGPAATVQQALQSWASFCLGRGDDRRGHHWQLQAALVWHWVGASAGAYQAWQGLSHLAADPDLGEFYAYWACFLDIRAQVATGDLTRMAADSLQAVCPTLSLPDPDALPELRRPVTDAAATPTLRLYPNPAQRHLLVELTLPHALTAPQLTLHDALGRTLRQHAWPDLASGKQLHKLDLRGLPAGVYTVQLQAAGWHRAQRVRVE